MFKANKFSNPRKEARLCDKDEIIDDLKQDRDKWRQQATALLNNKKEKRGFLEKLFSS